MGLRRFGFVVALICSVSGLFGVGTIGGDGLER